ncbi:uncharacterized protein LOC106753085 [Vigna radiata var. radiata]|uniref:Uncharacterized protein LOC106753085 n=1 Tax=Vigna radiata var. radiata TaxID=3916 RepID=A0A1S3T9C6_VIGRR|nr:uncharacterized protein LOC106753085 [Vigna radiata var. radiata]
MMDGTVVVQGVGIALAALLTAIAEAMKNNPSIFKKKKAFDLANLESTLKSIEPNIRKMERLNNEMGRPKEELEPLIKKFEEGIKLLKQCSNVRWNSKAAYMAQLQAFDDSFGKLLHTIVEVQTATDQKEMLQLQHQKGFRRWLVCFRSK